MTPQIIADHLKNDILSGTLPPGQALSQTELAMRFGVSRIPVRDALAQLSASGLVELTPNRTAHVLQMSRADLIEAYDLRLMLECDLLTRAIPMMTDQHLSDIDYALARSDLEARNSNWAEGDHIFHAALYIPAKRPRQSAMITKLRRACCIQIASYKHLPEDTERWLTDHKTLRDSCHAQDTAHAAACLRSHLTAARDTLLQKMPINT